MPSTSSSSSGEEERRLRSVVVEFVPHNGAHCHPSELPNDRHGEKDPPHLKLYQTRVQDLLYDHLDKTFAWHFEGEGGGEKSFSNVTHEDDLGFHLFSRAPPGISVKQSPKGQPLKRRRLSVAKEDKKVGKEFDHLLLVGTGQKKCCACGVYYYDKYDMKLVKWDIELDTALQNFLTSYGFFNEG